jgi:hypothetical protein
MPGFLDIHTHYDAEVEAAPRLAESLRHGVTTVTFGSCSLGTVLSRPVDIADMFTRVEAVPYEFVLPLFEARKNWSTPAQYRAHIDTLALGPNITAFLGHSDLRAHVMGLGRAITSTATSISRRSSPVPTARSSENRSPQWRASAEKQRSTSFSISLPSMATRCAGSPSSATTDPSPSAASRPTPTFSSAFPTRAPICATWRITIFRCAC